MHVYVCLVVRCSSANGKQFLHDTAHNKVCGLCCTLKNRPITLNHIQEREDVSMARISKISGPHQNMDKQHYGYEILILG